MPINKNWLNVWKGRMSKKMILKDTTMLIMGAGNIWRICENIYKEIK